MRILFLTDGIEAPGSRYRCEQFFPYFRQAGIECDLRYAYGRLYNRLFTTPLGPGYKVATRLRRAWHTAFADGGFDALFLQRTAFPQFALPEIVAAARGLPLIFDFDDAIFLGPGGEPDRRREGAFRRTVELSDHCIAGNGFLREHARAPHKTTVIPTVIDTNLYLPPDHPQVGNDVIIGWMGTASNFTSLEQAVPALLRVLEAHPNARVRLVSNAVFHPLEGVAQVEQIRWSARTEVELLQSFDVGLMPLVDNASTRGKCAFKMIQYMSVGCPVVVSAVGANVEVGAGAGIGFVLESFDEWPAALEALIAQPDLRRQMGARARARAVEAYSVRAVLPAYFDVFASVTGVRRPAC